jgi:hypothetical protein
LFMKGLGGNSQGSSNQETEVSAQIGTSNLNHVGRNEYLFGLSIVHERVRGK